MPPPERRYLAVHEARIIEEEANADKQARLAALAASLPARVPTDVEPTPDPPPIP